MASLYEINQAIADVIDGGFHVTEDGEVFEEEDLEHLKVDFDTKLENVALYCKNLDSDSEAIMAESKALAERAKSKKAKSERLKGYLSTAMVSADRTKLETARCRLSFRKSTRVNVYSEADVPEEYITHKDTATVNKTAIKQAYQAGHTVPGANVVETMNLQLK